MVWTPAERKAWSAPKRLSVSKWAEERRVLTTKESSEPGKWRNHRTPFLIEIMDTLGDRAIDVVVIQKPSQIGGSEAVRNFVGWAAEQDPGPTLWVLAKQKSAKESAGERLIPMIKASLPDMVTERSYDLNNETLKLTTMDIYLAWATSPSELATRPVRYVILDEVNKYVQWSGKDADPIALAKARTRTWGRRSKAIILSTPTIPGGQVSKAIKRCEDQRQYQIPCVNCGALFHPQWVQVKWPDRKSGETRVQYAARIRSQNLARLKCPGKACGYEMDESERLGAVELGAWISVAGAVENPRSVGFEFSVLATSWTPISDLAAKFLLITDPSELMEFINQELGEEWFERINSLEEETFEEKKRAGHKRAIVPAWAWVVLASVDTQKGYFAWVLRAFGRHFRSRLVDHGQAATFEELEGSVLNHEWPVQGYDQMAGCDMLVIDSGGGTAASSTLDGSRTDEVYRWSMTDERIKAIKGHGGKKPPAIPIRYSNTNYTPPGGKRGEGYTVLVHTINTKHFKDLLSARVKAEDKTLWETHDEIGKAYISQMCAEHLVFDRRTSLKVWQPRSKGRANHYWDAETYVNVAAVMIGVASLEELEDEDITKHRDAIEAQLIRSTPKVEPGDPGRQRGPFGEAPRGRGGGSSWVNQGRERGRKW